MGNIIILDENTSNKIAAGEVIEKPSSVVKELVENSVDASAGVISVEIKNGGISFIRVSDNGSGIGEDDAEIAFERHATSKIRGPEDLDSISTLGFRGEALASIAAVSSVELTTRVRNNGYGTFIKVQGGSVKEVRQTGCPVGTTLIVRDLFYNTPARYKFLKKDSTEAGYVSDIITRIALGSPHISLRLVCNNSTVIHTPGNSDLLSTIFSIYGKETAGGVSEINFQDNKLKITGYAGKPEIARSNRNQQSIFINGRYIKSKVITSAIDEAYNTLLMKNKFPFIIMNIEVNPHLVDVNVHPTKMEVRFSEEQDIFRSIYNAVSSTLVGRGLIRNISLDTVNPILPGPVKNESTRIEYVQQVLQEGSGYIKESGTCTFDQGPGADISIKEFGTDASAIDSSSNISNKTDVEKIKNNIQEKVNDTIEKHYNNEKHYNSEKHLNCEKHYNSEKHLNCEKHNNSGFLDEIRIIGQVFSTYILLQHRDEFLIIDQHAAHERILYDDLRKKYLNNCQIAQLLIAPVIIELTHQEFRLAEENKEYFSRLGYIYENFGNNSIILRSVPGITDPELVRETFLDALDLISGAEKAVLDDKADETLYNIACKAAIKANKKLDELEIKAILEGMKSIDNPFSCPHGRPTIIKIDKSELEKKFKRIV